MLSCSPKLYGADSCEGLSLSCISTKSCHSHKTCACMEDFPGEVRDTGEIHTPKEQTAFNYHLCFLNFCSHVLSLCCPLPGQEPGFLSWFPSLCHPFLCVSSAPTVCQVKPGTHSQPSASLGLGCRGTGWALEAGSSAWDDTHSGAWMRQLSPV